MKFNFVYDRFVNGKPYPNLAPLLDISRGYSELWHIPPRTLPIRLLYYFQCFDFAYQPYHIDQDYPADSFYPISLAWFDSNIDYIGLLPSSVKESIQQGRLRLLIYYHEGDNPILQNNILNNQCKQHNLPLNYKFITGNTAISNLDNFVYFADHELFYYKSNLQHKPLEAYSRSRSKDFTALNRVHKWWRATAMSHLVTSNLLNNSYWSYSNFRYDDDLNDNFDDNPIEIRTINLQEKTLNFVKNAPYTCDTLSTEEHNMHHTLVPEHFNDSYIHIVFETFFDADQSGGTFLSEKTFKPIKHGQPFIIVGPAGSLALLRSLGYRTFENVIDNSYDSITNNTNRWLAIHKLVYELKRQNLKEVFEKCMEDVLHNQQKFMSCGHERLATLLNKLNL